MSGNLIPVLFLLSLSALCILVGFWIVNHKLTPGKATTVNIPGLGTIKTDYPTVAIIFLGLVFAYFAFQLALPEKVKFVRFNGKVLIDKAALNDISSVVVGVTTSPWNYTGTPDRESGTMEISIPVPNNWNSYTGYAFAHGRGKVLPAVIGLRKDNPEFELDLRKWDTD